MSSKPNLFIIGAMKSGTTSLHNYLNAHPDIYMSDLKEPGYFAEELSWHKGENWYLSLFSAGEGRRYIGESSTHYTKIPLHQGVAERLHHFNPQAKLIYVMRDPFERLVSHYWHAVRGVYHGGEIRPVLKAVQEDETYVAFSNYAMQLRPYIDLFGRDALYTLTFEELLANTNKEVNRIYAWLGLPAHDSTEDSRQAHNQKPEQLVGVAGMGLLNRIQYSKTWDTVSHFVPQKLKNLGNKLAYKPIDESEQSADFKALKLKLRDVQKRQIDELSQLLGRSFPEWQDY